MKATAASTATITAIFALYGSAIAHAIFFVDPLTPACSSSGTTSFVRSFIITSATGRATMEYCGVTLLPFFPQQRLHLCVIEVPSLPCPAVQRKDSLLPVH